MTKSPPSSSPQSPQSSSSNTASRSKVKGITRFDFASAANRALGPSKDNRSRALIDGFAAIHVEQGKLPISNTGERGASTITQASNPEVNGQPFAVSADFFLNNIAKTDLGLQLPEIGSMIMDTAQLVQCVNLVKKATAKSPSSASLTTFNSVQLEWVRKMNDHPLEEEHLHLLLNKMVVQYTRQPRKDSDAIREIVLLGPVLDKDLYRVLLNCLLTEFKYDALLDVVLLQGLVQLVQDASVDFLKADDLIQILRIIRTHLEDPGQQNEEYSAQLTLAISKVLDVMASEKVKDLNRTEDHAPLMEILAGLKVKDDPFLRYQAQYAFQALQWVPDDETLLKCSLRHFAGIANGLIKMSGVIQLDFSKFLGGLQDIQKIVEDTSEVIKSGWEDVPALIEDSRGLFDSLKEGLGSGRKHPWYLALRGAQELVRNGQLADFNKLICEAPFRHRLLFLWGVCQLLAEIAIDPTWDMITRSQALKFLVEIHRITTNSSQYLDIRRWVVTLLGQISSLLAYRDSTGISNVNEAIVEQARTSVQGLTLDGTQPFAFPYLLQSRLPFPRVFSLLKEVNNSPDLELLLDRIRRQQWNEYDRQAIYIQPMSKPSLQSLDNHPVLLKKRVNDFLDSKAEVMLILGDSGVGKSTFVSHLEYELWEKYEPGGQIPLFVDLKAIDNPDKDMIPQLLNDLNITSPTHIEELRSRQFILICDGFDERRSWTNLHTNNKFNKPNQWMAKMIITCRTQYLNPDYRQYLEPLLISSASHSRYEEAVMVPFKLEQIEQYIEQYVLLQGTSEFIDDRQIWTTKQYLKRIREISSLTDFVKNPFMLRIVLKTLPRIASTTTHLTRAEIYDEFVEFHFENEQERLQMQKSAGTMEANCLSAFSEIEGDDFIILGIDFSMRLAHSIFKEQNGVNSVEPFSVTDKAPWKAEFFKPDAMTKLMLESGPLVCRSSLQQGGARRLIHSKNRQTGKKNSYAFSHRSILEYFYSRLVYDPSYDPPYETLSVCLASTATLIPIADHPLGQRNLVSEPSILHFLAERVQLNEEFKDVLIGIIQHSKTNPEVSQAAANAITILVQAGIRFHGADLKGIRVPGANLSYGQFDSTQLQGSDLRNTTLRSIWLRRADLSNALMDDVVFGEQPFLLEADIVNCCVFSPDERMFAAGLNDGTVTVYNTSTLTKIYSFQGHTDAVWGIAFSPCGQQIASRSWDGTVRLWDVQTGSLGPILEGHTAAVTCAVYSPGGQQIASCSADTTVRLWDAQTGSPGPILNGHTNIVWTVAYSPDGQQIASGSGDNTVRLWDAKTGLPGPTLTGHTDIIWRLVYSPDGQQIASGSEDTTVRLWDAETGLPGHVLIGHGDHVSCVVYSPDGQQIASGSADTDVRLWDAKTGSLGHILSGHEATVRSVAFSPNDQQIVSGSEDHTVRLWDVESGLAGPIFGGHTNSVLSVVYSPSGQLIASSSADNTVRLWDAQTRSTGHRMYRHSEGATHVVYSPNGQQIASGGADGNVHLWDAQEGSSDFLLSGHTDVIRNLVFSPDGQQLASCSDDQTVRLWDTKCGSPVHILSGHTGAAKGLVYSFDGLQIASSSDDHTIRLWDTESGSPGPIFDGHTGAALSVKYSPSEQMIVSSSQDHTVRLWNVQTSLPGPILSGHSDAVLCVVYSPNGQQIASGSSDNSVRLWDVETWSPGLILNGHKNGVLYVAYSPDGQQVASSSRDCTVRLWDSSTGSPGPILSGHSGHVLRAVYSHGGDLIASGGDDFTVRLWDPKSGRCLTIVQDFQEGVGSLCWSPLAAGSYFVTGCGDGTVRIWQVTEDDNGHHVQLHGPSNHDRLVLSDVSIEDVQGLSKRNARLLRQHVSQNQAVQSGFMPLQREDVQQHESNHGFSNIRLLRIHESDDGSPDSDDGDSDSDDGNPDSNTIEYVVTLENPNDAEAVYSVGVGFYEGNIVPQNHAVAANWFLKAAKLGHSGAMYKLGEMSRVGSGVPQDDSWALNLLLAAATKGHVHAQAKVGFLYETGNLVAQDHSEAIEWYMKAVDQGMTSLQTKIGYLYEKGDIAIRDYSKAIEWFLKGANRGDETAQFILGYMYEEGEGTPQDYSKAIEWYQKSTDQGNASAQLHLGDMYENGKGTPQDYSKAAELFLMSADRGHAIAQRRIADLYREGDGVPQDDSKALGWYLKSANQGNANAQCAVGHMYENGNGTLQDYSKAAEFYLMSAEQGHATAQCRLADLYCEGDGVPQDYSKALEWFMKAADQDEPEAQYRLGLLYEQGHGDPQDKSKAMEWYSMSAKQGYTTAQDKIDMLS